MSEITIDIKDMFLHILKKWKLIIAAAVLFAVLFNVSGYKKALASSAAAEASYRRYEEAAKELPGYFDQNLFNLKSSISENYAAFAEAYANIYKGFLDEYSGLDRDQSDNSNLTAYMMFLDSYKDVLSVMSNPQRAYFEALIAVDTDMRVNEGVDAPKFENATVNLFQPKQIAIGSVAGIILALVLISIPYIMSGRLRSIRDLELIYGIPNIAILKNDTTVESVSSAINAVVKKNGFGTVSISGGMSEKASVLKNELSAALKMNNIEVSFSDSITNSSASLEKASSSGCIIIAELSKDRYSDISKEVRNCRMFGAALLGSIIIE